jgi:predicted enzyme related to lactoylglutathione lyase
MAKVTGIGGIFFKAQDAEKSKAWYQEHLGLEIDQYRVWLSQWREKDRPQRVGQTVWSLFPADTDYFGSGGAPFMINYRVDNLDEMLAELRKAGVQVLDQVEEYEYGRFGWVIDPDGNRIELWEPRGEDGQTADA